MIDRYDWPGGSEALWRFGPATGPVVLLLLPPFEEANRTRTFAVGLLRALAARDIGAMLPDLPGQGDSLLPTDAVTLTDWRSAVVALVEATDRPVVTAAIRASALLDRDADVAGRWHLAPQTGERLLRELSRIGIDRDGDMADVAGNRLSATLLAELETATPATVQPLRTVRLGTDPGPADLRIDAAPLWRRSEPGNDPDLAAALADDLAAWSRACVGW
ncbi:hypothetical protein ASE73_14865 [Sphingomonas sp. Leaf24]|uniref:hypothetical protein n=1 Tax=unclassified Sphingomonas TaxID=196159 RepID=UPI0006F942B1|nr:MULTISPECIES: hypothetical protein [unclassified Sphingomonas]KQM21664.1 hypothetical protein ASE50_13085 [Sphingomonas sp. Leaf5]KQM86870.1 hypothetical protein ASE70_17310 [Sphingomonas sp. Leaf22]KQM93767.1 hypothetical protein ASE73_14865 [Sphingomonas sp. Leaf24]